jgi:hypothetical protein
MSGLCKFNAISATKFIRKVCNKHVEFFSAEDVHELEVFLGGILRHKQSCCDFH